MNAAERKQQTETWEHLWAVNHPATATTANSRPYYVVRTDNGYVGRDTVTAPLTDDMMSPFASCWTSRTEAEKIAADWHGTVEVI